MGPEADDPGRSARLLALAAALAAACFVRGIRHHLPRPPPHRGGGRRAREADRFSLAAMLGFAGALPAGGILPGAVIDALAPVSQALTGGRMPMQTGAPWLTIVPIAAAPQFV